MYCPARDEEYEAGDISDLVLDCGGTVSFTQSFVYLGSLLHRDLSDHHDVDVRIKKASKTFGALRDHFFSTRDMTVRLKGKIWVEFWRCCCMVASRGASRLSPSLACKTGTTNAYVKCAG